VCQLFGLNSARPVSPHFSLRGFFRRGGGADHHADGWDLAYSTTQLFWTERKAPFWRAELVGENEQTIDFAEHNDEHDRIVVVATRPLTRLEPWFAMGQRELKAVVGGNLYASFLAVQPRATHQRKRRDGLAWCTGWQLENLEIL